MAWSLAAQRPDLMQFVIIQLAAAIPFARLAHDAAQIEASLCGTGCCVARAPESVLEDNFARLLTMLDSMSDDERRAYRSCWRHGLTGGCSYTADAAAPIPGTNPPIAAAVAAALRPERFRVTVPPRSSGAPATRHTPDPARRHQAPRARTCACTTLKAPATGWRRQADEVSGVLRTFLGTRQNRTDHLARTLQRHYTLPHESRLALPSLTTWLGPAGGRFRLGRDHSGTHQPVRRATGITSGFTLIPSAQRKNRRSAPRLRTASSLSLIPMFRTTAWNTPE